MCFLDKDKICEGPDFLDPFMFLFVLKRISLFTETGSSCPMRCPPRT